MKKAEVEHLIEELQTKLGNLKVILAVPMGVLMILYFFSYATLIDKGFMGLLYFELLSSIAFIFALIYLNTVAFKVFRWRYRGNSQYQTLLAIFDAQSINNSPDKLSEKAMSAFPAES